MRVHGIEIKAPQLGVVGKWWKSAGCGYIAGDDGNQYYVPQDGLDGTGQNRLQVGQRVQFESGDGENARVTALIFQNAINRR